MIKFDIIMYTISTVCHVLCSLGAIADLDLAIRSKKINDDIMVVSTKEVCTMYVHVAILCVY